jgi:hypothetical protein
MIFIFLFIKPFYIKEIKMLRIKIQELIKKTHERGFSKEEISTEIYDFLDDEGLGIHGNGWSDKSDNLADFIELDCDNDIKLSAVRILDDLDTCGLGIEDNGWLDDDDEWASLLEQL